MAIIPRVISNTGASGAQVIENSTYFDADDAIVTVYKDVILQYLKHINKEQI